MSTFIPVSLNRADLWLALTFPPPRRLWLQQEWNNDSMTEEEILKQICAGGRAQDVALKALYAAKAAEFKRHFVHKGVRPDVAEDVLQETIVKIFKGAATFHGNGTHSDNSANAWMWTIARNCMNDHLGKSLGSGKQETTVDDAHWADLMQTVADTKAYDSAATQAVNLCIARGLEDFAGQEPDRARVLMMQMDGEDITSIGNRIGRTMAATKEYLSQCRKKVASYIAHCQVLLPA
jgi:DNA-directed RNA polymerase specialized sigma24 family protein